MRLLQKLQKLLIYYLRDRKKYILAALYVQRIPSCCRI